MRLKDISNSVLEKLTATCTECRITNDIIDKQSVSCKSESLQHVTYSARLEGTSETDSGSLISLIEEWVSGGASIIMAGIQMTVDSECSVAISSLSEKECFPTTSTMTTNDNAASIVTGGVVAVVFMIASTVVVLAIAVFFIVKNCGKVSINHNEE